MLRNKKKLVALVYGLILVFLLTLAAGCGAPQKTAAPQPPAAAQPAVDKRDVIAKNGVVAAAHPLAAQAGLEVLQKGGNAFDAAIATSFALNVVEPNASGMGGGGFAVIYVAKEKKSYVIDYREVAPAKAKPDMYALDANGKVVDNATTTGYRAVAVPGQLRGMEMLQQKFGTMKWEELMQPAIKLAEAGLPVTKNLSGIITDEADRLKKAPAWSWMQKVYYKDGLPMQAGDTVKNTELTESLKKVAKGGPDVFYKGEIADAIDKEFATKGGDWITKEDLAGYKAIMREPVGGTYRGYELVTLPPASSGGLALVEMLNILEGFDLKKMGQGSADQLHTVIETQKLAFADRGKYMADSAFAKVPIAGLMDKKYAEERRKEIDPQKDKATVDFGNPSGHGSTTSFSVADKDGNMITITQTINFFFGSGVVPEGTGILLNDEMDDFVPDPKSVNAPEPGKRPLSSMTPTIVLKDGKPFMTVGSPGATRIITAIANIIMNVVDYGMDLQSAIVAPRFHNPNRSTTDVEGRIPQDVLKNLEARGHKFTVKKEVDPYFGGAQGIMFKADGTMHGAADNRRLGMAVGY